VRLAAWVTRSRRLAETWEPERLLRFAAGDAAKARQRVRANGPPIADARPLRLRALQRPAPLPVIVSGDPVAKGYYRKRLAWGFPRLHAGCDFSRLAGSKACVAANPETARPLNSVMPFHRLPSREAPRSVIHTIALFEECNSGRRVGTEIGGGAVGMLFGSGKCCGTVWKTWAKLGGGDY